DLVLAALVGGVAGGALLKHVLAGVDVAGGGLLEALDHVLGAECGSGSATGSGDSLDRDDVARLFDLRLGQDDTREGAAAENEQRSRQYATGDLVQLKGVHVRPVLPVTAGIRSRPAVHPYVLPAHTNPPPLSDEGWVTATDGSGIYEPRSPLQLCPLAF